MYNIFQVVTDYAVLREILVNEQNERNFFTGPIEGWLARLAGGGNVALPISPRWLDVVVETDENNQWIAVDV